MQITATSSAAIDEDAELEKLHFTTKVRLASILTKSPAQILTDRNARTAIRTRIHQIGIVHDMEEKEIRCMVIDFSTTGVRLKFFEDVSLPGEFQLSVPTANVEGVVKKRWAQGREVGVEFICWGELTNHADQNLRETGGSANRNQFQVSALMKGDGH